MSALFDVWPFPIRSGPEFLFVFLVLALVSVGGAWLASALVAALLESGDGPSERRLLRVGTIPWPTEAWAIAWLRRGEWGLADALLAAAIALRWIVPTQSGVLVPLGQPPPTDPVLLGLYQRLTQQMTRASEVRSAASQAARAARGVVEEQLRAAGMLRTAAVKVIVVGTVTTLGLAVELIGLVRAVRGALLGRPIDLLVCEMVGVLALVAAVALVAGRARSWRASRYLRWLREVTTSLSAEVRAGCRQAPEDVATAVAVGGIAGVLAAPMFATSSEVWEVTASHAGSGSCSSGCGSGCGGCGSGSGCGG